MRASNKLLPVMLTSAFLAVIWMPLLGSLFGIGVGTHGGEKRAAAGFPTWQLLRASGLPEYIAGLQAFWNDHLGFRVPMIRANSYLRYKLFNTSSSTRVRPGEQGWLYYHEAVEQHRTDMLLDARTLEEMTRILERRSAWLARRNIEYLVVLAPDKISIYPEFLPAFTRCTGRTQADQLAEAMASHPEVQFLDLRPILRAAKPQGLSYHRTDTHWNDLGALIAYRAIVARLEPWLPGLRPLQDADFLVTAEPGSGGDLLDMLAIADMAGESRVRLQPRRPFTAREQKLDHPGVQAIHASANSQAPAARLVAFGDSFLYFTSLKAYLGETFQRAVFVRERPGFFDPELIERERPDVVIQEVVERSLRYAFDSNPGQVECGLTGGRKLLSLGQQDPFTGLQAIHQVSFRPGLTRAGNTMTVVSEGKDPHFLLPALAARPSAGIAILVDMTSPVASNLRVYYQTSQDARFSDGKSIQRPTRKGRNLICVTLEESDLDGKIRIDPGAASGEYVVHSIEVYGIAP